MKYLKIDLTVLIMILLFAATTTVFGQQQEEVKKEKKVVIITKTIDEDGNVETKKIIKKGSDADVFIMEDGTDPVDGLDKTVTVDVDEMDGEHKVKIRIKKGEGDEDVEVLEWTGDEEMPAELRKRLEEKGMKWKVMGDENVFHFDTNDAPNQACLGVMIGMKKTVENINGEETTTTEGESELGVPVLDIIEDSGAADAGLAKDDIITRINGTEVASIQDVLDVLSPFEAGQTVSVDYLRDDQVAQVSATLKACGSHPTKNIEKRFEWIDEDGNNIDHGGNNWIFIEDEDNGQERKVIIKKNKDGLNEIVDVDVLEDDGINDFSENNINTLDLEKVELFPNPTDGKMTVKFTAPATATIVKVSDLSGKEIYSESLNDFDGAYNKELDLSKAATGALILSIHQGDKIFSEKIIIQK